MKDRKFTPGKWMPYSDGNRAWVRNETKLVATMSLDHDRSDADAKLIAAAPEMLQALELCHAVLWNGYTADSDAFLKARKAALDAIKSAEGKK